MGESSLLGSDHVVAFINASGQDATEVNRPDLIVDHLEADWMLLEGGVGEEEQPLLQANRGRVGDAP
jgi:hypothetical protein